MITKLKIFVSGLLVSAMLISAAPHPAKADVNNFVNAVIIDCAVAAVIACVNTDGVGMLGDPKDYTDDFISSFEGALIGIQLNRAINSLTGDQQNH